MSSELAEVGEKRRRFERDDEGFAGGESSEEEEQQKAESRTEVITCFILIKSAIPIGGFVPLGHCDFGNRRVLSLGEETLETLESGWLPDGWRHKAQRRAQRTDPVTLVKTPKKVPYSKTATYDIPVTQCISRCCSTSTVYTVYVLGSSTRAGSISYLHVLFFRHTRANSRIALCHLICPPEHVLIALQGNTGLVIPVRT